MPTIYLSPSTQEYNPYVTGGSEEYYMNLLADALEPYLVANDIGFTRNDPEGSASASIRESNAGNYDLHLALHSNASPAETAGQNRGIVIYYFPGNLDGKKSAEIFADNFKEIYPLPQDISVMTTTRLGEVRQPKATSTFLEIGFHDNVEDAQWITGNLPAIARAIALSLNEYFSLPFSEPDLLQKGRVSVSSENLNLRASPSVSSQILTSIPNDTVLNLQNEYNGWYSTSFNGIDGYVNASYVDII